MSLNQFIQFAKQVVTKGGGAISHFSFYKRWRRSLMTGSNPVADEQPWITYPVIDYLNKYLTGQSLVFEYGGGGSTLFFVNRAKEVVTVEHDKTWFATLENIMANRQSRNWKGNLVEPEHTPGAEKLDIADPDQYYTDDEHFRDCTFKTYATQIDRYPDNYFDIVLVDGRSRPACIKHSIPKLKKGGLLVVDNSNRKYYFTFFKEVLDKEFNLVYNKKAPSPYATFFTKTGVWKKL